jgi:subtilisin family serine protease
VFQPGATATAMRKLKDKAGVTTVSTAEAGFVHQGELGDRHLVLEKLGVTAVTMDTEQFDRVSVASEDSGFMTIVPERLLFPAMGPGMIPGQPVPIIPGVPITSAFPVAGAVPIGYAPDYWRGYRDGVSHVVEGIAPTLGGPPLAVPPISGLPISAAASASATQISPGAAGPFSALLSRLNVADAGANDEPGFDESQATWGLQVTNVLGTQFTGKGVRVAILDTGLDFGHPDFQDGRVKGHQSFIQGESDQDDHGHGTHCAGTACGPLTPSNGGRRYGIACDAEIFIGKVMPNNGHLTGSPEFFIMAGIEWAMDNDCRVVSMSISGQTPNEGKYDAIGRRALNNNTMLIAAAGNDSQRPTLISPVGSPANSPWFMSVGAVDSGLAVAPFSNRGSFPPAHAIDIVAPGVNVYSSSSRTGRALPPQFQGLYRKLSGTSQATPHVAGIAALIAEARPDWTAAQILDTLMAMAKALPGDDRDIGHGLVQARQGS